MESHSERNPFTRVNSSLPSRVSCTPALLRMSRSDSRRCSNRCIAALNEGCVMPSRSAAREMLPTWATSTKYSRSECEMGTLLDDMGLTYDIDCHHRL